MDSGIVLGLASSEFCLPGCMTTGSVLPGPRQDRTDMQPRGSQCRPDGGASWGCLMGVRLRFCLSSWDEAGHYLRVGP